MTTCQKFESIHPQVDNSDIYLSKINCTHAVLYLPGFQDLSPLAYVRSNNKHAASVTHHHYLPLLKALSVSAEEVSLLNILRFSLYQVNHGMAESQCYVTMKQQPCLPVRDICFIRTPLPCAWMEAHPENLYLHLRINANIWLVNLVIMVPIGRLILQ